MLEFSINSKIRNAYNSILENAENMNREYAYHCTDVNPDIILKKGFSSKGGNGLTEDNYFEELYKEYLPDNQCFVSKTPWNSDTKYILKIDITGLPKYPDFGSLVDTGAYYEESDDGDYLFYWENKDLTNLNSYMPNSLLQFLTDGKSEDEKGILYASDFDGETSYRTIGTCCIDGDLITPDRIEIVDKKVTESNKPSSEKDWKAITNRNKVIEYERMLQIVPSQFASCMKYDNNYGAILVLGVVRNKILSEAASSKNGIEKCTLECRMNDDGDGLLFDITITPRARWDREPINMVKKYIEKYAPWIFAHKIRDVEDEKTMLVRYELKDSDVLNSARKILGIDTAKDNYVQMELGI